MANPIRALISSWTGHFRQPAFKSAFQVSFARSSGPGGQKVNKTSSKAIVRLDLNQIPPIPSPVLPLLLKSPFYSSKSHSLVAASDNSRSQSQNRQDAEQKIIDTLLSAADNAIPNEADPEKLKRAAAHASREKLINKANKMQQKEKKQARRTLY